MVVLVTYDVSTTTADGRRRLRRVARRCVDFGRRVQFSVFECQVNWEEWTRLKLELLDIFNSAEDSLRFYYLGNGWRDRVEHHGIKPAIDFDEPLIT
jgi:CRISPR-associated protein Cas2